MTKNPLAKRLENHKIILASGSPRRKKFFEDLGIPFEIRLQAVEEQYPSELKEEEISNFLAELKSTPFLNGLRSDEILITSDTVVWCNGESLEKAESAEEAASMLKKLSGAWHKVITSVCFATKRKITTVHCTTLVKIKSLTKEEIAYYIETCNPFDKAGAYGIQEWLGMIGIEEIKGSYTNVVGLPTHLVYKTLMDAEFL